MQAGGEQPTPLHAPLPTAQPLAKAQQCMHSPTSHTSTTHNASPTRAPCAPLTSCWQTPLSSDVVSALAGVPSLLLLPRWELDELPLQSHPLADVPDDSPPGLHTPLGVERAFDSSMMDLDLQHDDFDQFVALAEFDCFLPLLGRDEEVDMDLDALPDVLPDAFDGLSTPQAALAAQAAPLEPQLDAAPATQLSSWDEQAAAAQRTNGDLASYVRPGSTMEYSDA